VIGLSRQKPFLDKNTDGIEKYRKKLYVDIGMKFMEVKAKIIEPYSPPTPITKLAEISILNAPSHIHQSGIALYKCSFRLLFDSRMAYKEYMAYVGWMHKLYDERGNIFIGSVEDIKPASIEANKRYLVDLTLSLIKKDSYDARDRFEFQDIEGHWAEDQIKEMSNLGILSVTTKEGEPVLQFRPNDLITRAEFITMLNRTRRLLERVIRE
jgi:hypothetical protein